MDWVVDLARGMALRCREAGAAIVGGDLSAGEGLVVAVTVHGDLRGRAPVLRSGARAGEALVLAGAPGRAAAGLALLEAGWGRPGTGWGSRSGGGCRPDAEARAGTGAVVGTDAGAESFPIFVPVYNAYGTWIPNPWLNGCKWNEKGRLKIHA